MSSLFYFPDMCHSDLDKALNRLKLISENLKIKVIRSGAESTEAAPHPLLNDQTEFV